jgi:polysaccharide biosynthesis transport protein
MIEDLVLKSQDSRRSDDQDSPAFRTMEPAARTAMQDGLAMLRRRRWVVLAVLAVSILAALGYIFLSRPLYESDALLVESSDSSGDLNIEQMALQTDTDADKKLQTQVQIIAADSTLLTVVDKLQLQKDPWFYNPHGLSSKIFFWTKRPEPTDNILDGPPGVREAILKKIDKHLKVEVVPRTMVLSVSFRSPSPEMSTKVVNAIVQAYLHRNVEVRFKQMNDASSWLGEQLTGIKANAEGKQSELVKYQKDHNILLLGEDQSTNDITVKLQQLSKELVAAQTDRIMKEAKFRLASTGNPELVAQVAPNSTLSMLRQQEADLTGQYAEAVSKYGVGYPHMAELKERLQTVRNSIQREVHNITESLRLDYNGSQETEQKLSAAVDRQRAEAFKLNSDAVGYEVLEREVVATQELYQGLQEKLQEAGVLAGLKSNNTDVLNWARPSSKPAEPDAMLSLFLGVFGGGLVGCCVAFVLEKIDDKISGADDLEKMTGLPSLVVIPYRRKIKGESTTQFSYDMVTIHRPRSELAEAFRSLRSSLLLSAGTAPRLVIVTSTFPGEGKTTTAVNTALAFAQQGSRVLLIDADLRRPSVHTRLTAPYNGGLSEVLSGQRQLSDVVVPFPELPSLSLLAAGPIPPQPSEMLGSARMREVLEYARAHYDFVVLDSPPVLAVTDAVILSAVADRVVYICREGSTSRHALLRGLSVLGRVNAHFAGLVVNGVNTDGGSRYYYGSKRSRDYYLED